MSEANQTSTDIQLQFTNYEIKEKLLDNPDKLDYQKIVSQVTNIDRAQLQALSSINKDTN